MFKPVSIAVAALFALATPTFALARADPAPAAAKSYAEADAREAAAQATLSKAMADFQRGRYAALRPHLPALEALLDDAPASYPVIEDRGEITIVRSRESAVSLLALLGAAKDKRSTRVEIRENTYPMIALILASNANESRQSQKAVAYLDRGLAIQPGNSWLLSEKGAALNAMRKPAEALATYDAGLAGDLPIAKTDRALLLRGRGYALIELGRLDEAEAAYRESLTLEPDHGGALHELKYIADLKKGRTPPQGSTGLISSDEAKDYGKEPKPK